MLDSLRMAAAMGFPRRLGSGRWTARRPAAPRSSPPGRPVRTALRTAIAVALFAALLAGLLWPRPATAGAGIYLSWDDCALSPAHSQNRTFACNDNASQKELDVAFTMPQAVDNLIAVEIVVDLQSAGSVLPDWWRLDPDGCRRGNILQASADFVGKTACQNLWAGSPDPPVVGVQGYIPTEPRGQPSQARIKVDGAVLPQNMLSVNETDMYYAARIIITNEKTVEPPAPACAGCDVPVCLVLNSILIGRYPVGANDLFLQTPGPNNANWVTWQNGTGADCTAVPVRNRTWGEIKSLYRR